MVFLKIEEEFSSFVTILFFFFFIVVVVVVVIIVVVVIVGRWWRWTLLFRNSDFSQNAVLDVRLEKSFIKWLEGFQRSMGCSAALCNQENLTKPLTTFDALYRVCHLVIDLGLVDFDMNVLQYCPSVKPLLRNSHQPMQSWADSVEQSKSKSTKPSLRPDGTPCTVGIIDQLCNL